MLRVIKLLIFFLPITALFFSGLSQAADSYTLAGNATITVNEHGICRRVTNTTATSQFIPTKTAAEWNAVIANAQHMTFANCSCAFNTWTQTSAPEKIWSSLWFSEDGSVIAAYAVSRFSMDAPVDGELYISTNGGSTWTKRGPTAFMVYDLDMSDDGTTMIVAGAPSDRYADLAIYVSTNKGTSWTQRTNVVYPQEVAVSGDGSTMYSSSHPSNQPSRLYKSTNNGSSWTQLTAHTFAGITGIDTNGDGTKIATTTYVAPTGGVGTGNVRFSSNGGTSFAVRGPQKGWMSLTGANDLGTLLSMAYEGSDFSNNKNFISQNSGTSWTDTNIGAPLYSAVGGLASDGQSLVATRWTTTGSGNTYELMYSSNGGTSWSVIRSNTTGLGGAAISGDGQTIGYVSTTGFGTGRIFLSSCN